MLYTVQCTVYITLYTLYSVQRSKYYQSFYIFEYLGGFVILHAYKSTYILPPIEYIYIYISRMRVVGVSLQRVPGYRVTALDRIPGIDLWCKPSISMDIALGPGDGVIGDDTVFVYDNGSFLHCTVKHVVCLVGVL